MKNCFKDWSQSRRREKDSLVWTRREVWLGDFDRPDMTITFDWGVKHKTKRNKKGTSGDQVRDLLCVWLGMYLERGGGALMRSHLHVNQKSDMIMIYIS